MAESYMSYEKNTWTAGQAITSTKMNHIEDGVEYSVRNVNSYLDQKQAINTAITKADEASSKVVQFSGSIEDINRTLTGHETWLNDLLRAEYDNTNVVYDSPKLLAQYYSGRIQRLYTLLLDTTNTASHIKRIQDLETTVNDSTIGNVKLNAQIQTINGELTPIWNKIQDVGKELGIYQQEFNDETHQLEWVWTSADSYLEEVGKNLGMYKEISKDNWAWVTDTPTRLDTVIDLVDTLIGESSGGSDVITPMNQLSTDVTNLKAAVYHEVNGLSPTNALANSLNAMLGSGFNSTTGNTVTDKVATLESNLLTKANTADVTAALATKVDTSVYNTLENTVDSISTTIIVPSNKVTFDNATNKPQSFDSSIEIIEKNDYLIQGEDDKYYYWKPIKVSSNPITYTWEKISGGGSGGTGDTSSIVLTEDAYDEIQTKTVNTDYYVLGETDEIYHHYRWIPTEIQGETVEIEIGQIINVDTNKIKRYRVAKHDRMDGDELTSYLDFYEFGYDVITPEIDDSDHSLNRIAAIALPKGGSGSGEITSDKVCIVSYVSSQNQIITQSAAKENGIKVSFFYQAYEPVDEGDGTITYITSPGTYTLKKGNRIVASNTIQSAEVVQDEYGNPVVTNAYKLQNAISIPVTNYCNLNEPTDFVLTVTSNNGITRTRPFRVEIVELELKSTFDAQRIFNAGTAIRIPLTITSPERNKTIYVKMDEGTEDAYSMTQVHGEKASSNTTITIPADKLTQGLHKIRIYFEEIITGSTTSPSNDLVFDIACRDEANDTTVLLSSPYRGTTIEVDQYKTVRIPYYLYIPDGIIVSVVKTNNITNHTTTEDGESGAGEFIIRASEASEINNDELVPYTISIGCLQNESQVADPSITVNIKVRPNEYNIEPVLDGLVFDFNPTGYINNPQNEQDKYWVDVNNSSIKLEEVEGENFDWDNGGWQYDDEAEAPYFCVKAGSRAQINYSLFQDNMETAGSEFKCIFKAVNVRDPEAVFLTSLDNDTSTVTEYEPDMMASDQDVEDEDTLLHNYMNVREGYVLTLKGSTEKERKLAVTALAGTMSDADFDAALESARAKVFKKNVTDYITNIVSYVTAYDGEDAADLAALVNSNSLDTKSEAEAVSETLETSATWATFRETDTYANIMVDLPTLIKNLALTYTTIGDSQNPIITSNFASQTITDDHIDEYAKQIVKNVHAIKANGEIVDSQIEIAYKIENETTVYSQITLLRPIKSVTERSHGLEMRAHRANIHLGGGTLTYPYSEEDIIEFEYNISNPISKKKTAPILMYEDGVPSAAMLYSTGSNALVQSDKGNLIIGSDDCDIWIYRMKFYNKKLNNNEILSNFYADALNPDDMISRYENNIATYTDGSDPDSITPQSVATACPELRVIMIEAPKLTDGKNSFIKNSKIRCIYKGEDARPEDNWVALNAYHAGQGTSSDAYGAAGRNLDIIFGFNGTDQLIAPKAKNNYRFDSSYKSILVTGIEDTDNSIISIDELVDIINDNKAEGTADISSAQLQQSATHYTVDNLDIYTGGTGKVNFNDNAIENSWFNIKLNIASSENANNALLQKRFDRYLKEIYTTPAQKRDSRIKNDMEFFNCVVFIKETGDPSEFTDDRTIAVENRQWHFYGIGNIGDSKKTDDTRVNIPGDPNEFCVEVTDNGLTNSGFSTGVYWTDSTKTATTYTAAGSYEMKYPVTMEEWKDEGQERNLAYNAIIDYEEDGGWDKSFEFRYDISTKDGNTIADSEAEKALATARQEYNKSIFKDMYEWVITAPTTGDNSFSNHLRDWFIETSPLYWYVFTERYTMIDSRAKNTFYHYGKVYVSAEEIDGDTVDQCTRVHECELALAAAQEGTDEAAIAEAQTAYDTAVYVWNHKDCFILEGDYPGSYIGAAQIHNGYRFDMWDYDNDTALGINNNGKMVFDAGLEDIDRTANAWVYNEATNVFWRRIRNEMYNKLREVYTSRRSDCFNAENLITEFDAWQAQFPENLWRMDFERKYQRPYLEGNNMRYLRDMANGRKKYQRREFERNMCIYIDSKYVLTDAYNPNDFIQFRPTSQQNDNQDKMVNITCYSPMYINFSIGNQSNTEGSHERCLAGETKSFNFFAGIVDTQNIQTKIFNASRIKEITGLENYYADDLDFTAAKKLRKITIGSNVAKIIDPITGEESTIPYRNNNTTTLELRGNPILEELDIRNCTALAAELDLSECISLSKLYATGTPLTKVNLAVGGLIKELYLPASITSLNFNNLYLLDTLQLAGYNNLISYISRNVHKYNAQTLIFNVLSQLTTLKANDINWTIEKLVDLEPVIALQQTLGENMSLRGTITITGNWSEVKLNDYKDILGINNITWNVNENKKIQEYKLSFYLSAADYNNNNVYYSKYIQPPDSGLDVALGNDPVYVGDCVMPTKANTVSTAYYFGTDSQEYLAWRGWRFRLSSATPSNNTNIRDNTDFIAVFGEEARKYPLHWYLNNTDTTPVKTVSQIAYGSSYEDSIAPTVLDLKLANKQTASINTTDGINCTYNIFKGWQKEPINLDSTFLHTIPNSTEQAFCIYGDWETGTSTIDALKNAATVDAKKLLLLTNIEEGKTIYPIGSTLDIIMGQDKADGTVIIGPNATESIGPQGKNYTGESTTNPILSFVYDSQNATTNPPPCAVTNIKPFAEMESRGFTLVVDYQLNASYIKSLYGESAEQYVIIGGSYTSGTNDTTQGFAIYYDCGQKVSKVCFGNLASSSTYSSSTYSCAITDPKSANGRNIVVIRHQADSNVLEIYSGISATSGILMNLNNSFKQELTWSKNTSNAPLCFGHFTTNTFSSLSNIHAGAGVSIHWAKYWNSDLGYNSCIQLAAWPHEKLRFAVEDYSNDNNNDVLNTTSQNIIFSALQLSQYGGPQAEIFENYRTDNLTVTWGSEINATGNSLYKRIANYRFFLGLPIEIQSIIMETYGHASVVKSQHGQVWQWVFDSNIETTDLAFLPTYYEVGGTDSRYTQEATRPMPWYSSGNNTVYTYDGSMFDRTNTTHNINFMNLRFFGIPIKHNSSNIYQGYTSSTPVYNKIEGTDSHIQSGDIFIHQVTSNGTTTNTAYIYADAADKAAGAPIIIAQSGDVLYCPVGGWIQAQSWWTRSTADWTTGANSKQPYYYVAGNTGVLTRYSTPMATSSETGAYFTYSFGV